MVAKRGGMGMKYLLGLLICFTYLTGFAANPAFTAFKGTNGILVSSNVTSGVVLIDGIRLTNGASSVYYTTNLFVNNEYVSNIVVTNINVNQTLITSNTFTTNLFVSNFETVSNIITTNLTVNNNEYVSNIYVTSNLFVNGSNVFPIAAGPGIALGTNGGTLFITNNAIIGYPTNAASVVITGSNNLMRVQ